MKFVFPTASKRRSTILKKIPINQWFDNYSLNDPNQRTDLQIDGLRETAAFLRELITREAHDLDSEGETGYQKIVLGGLSQGCAAGVFALLGGGLGKSGNEKIGAFFGMSGWLPFEGSLGEMFGSPVRNKEDELDALDGHLQSLDMSESDGSGSDDEVGEDDDDDDDSGSDNDNDESDEEHSDGDQNVNSASSDLDGNPFASNLGGDEISFDMFQSQPLSDPDTNIMDAINFIRDILDLPPFPTPASDNNDAALENEDSLQAATANYAALQTPVFLGHGSADPKVSVRLGEKMTRLLADRLEMDVTWKAYEGFGHWYKVPDEIDDVIAFLQRKVGLAVVEQPST